VPFLIAVSPSSCYSLDGFDLTDMPILALKFGTKADASGVWKFFAGSPQNPSGPEHVPIEVLRRSNAGAFAIVSA
jgi:hypothetical protein